MRFVPETEDRVLRHLGCRTMADAIRKKAPKVPRGELRRTVRVLRHDADRIKTVAGMGGGMPIARAFRFCTWFFRFEGPVQPDALRPILQDRVPRGPVTVISILDEDAAVLHRIGTATGRQTLIAACNTVMAFMANCQADSSAMRRRRKAMQEQRELDREVRTRDTIARGEAPLGRVVASVRENPDDVPDEEPSEPVSAKPKRNLRDLMLEIARERGVELPETEDRS